MYSNFDCGGSGSGSSTISPRYVRGNSSNSRQQYIQTNNKCFNLELNYKITRLGDYNFR